MANIIKEGNTWTQLTISEDWISSYQNFISCKFSPSTAGDYIVIREYPVDNGTSTAATSDWPGIRLRSISGEMVECEFKGKRRSRLCVPVAECSLASASLAMITFEVG